MHNLFNIVCSVSTEKGHPILATQLLFSWSSVSIGSMNISVFTSCFIAKVLKLMIAKRSELFYQPQKRGGIFVLVRQINLFEYTYKLFSQVRDLCETWTTIFNQPGRPHYHRHTE